MKMSSYAEIQNLSSKVSLSFIMMDAYPRSTDSSDYDSVLTKTEIYLLSHSVRIFKCFKWNAFKTIFSIKSETMLELFNIYSALYFILSN